MNNRYWCSTNTIFHLRMLRAQLFLTSLHSSFYFCYIFPAMENSFRSQLSSDAWMEKVSAIGFCMETCRSQRTKLCILQLLKGNGAIFLSNNNQRALSFLFSCWIENCLTHDALLYSEETWQKVVAMGWHRRNPAVDTIFEYFFYFHSSNKWWMSTLVIACRTQPFSMSA